jgi:glycosyltransferase involved in cell wall biosynthesis
MTPSGGAGSRHIMLVSLGAPGAVYSGGGMVYNELVAGFLGAGWRVSAAYLETAAGPDADRAYEESKRKLADRGVACVRRLQCHFDYSRRKPLPRLVAMVRRRLFFTPDYVRPWHAAGGEAQAIVDELKPDVCFLWAVDAIAAFMDVRGPIKVGGIGVLPHKLEASRRRLDMMLRPFASLILVADAVVRYRHVRRNIRELLASTDAIIAFAAGEAEDCRRFVPDRDVEYLPNMVTDDGWSWKPSGERTPPYRVVLVGHLRGTATRSGLHFFATRILPALRRLGCADRFEFEIIGKFDPPEWLVGLLRKENVRFLGFVEDFAACVSSADAMLVPIPDDVGNRSRIASAWSSGCCVVTHESSVRGMPEVEHGVNALVGSDGQDIAVRLLEACSDRGLNEKLRRQGRATYEKHYRPDAAFPPIERFVRKLVVSHGAGASTRVSATR